MTSEQNEDDWSTLRDSAQRRRIQNRLAQRNYRRKQKDMLKQQELQTCQNPPLYLRDPTPRGYNNNQNNYDNNNSTTSSSSSTTSSTSSNNNQRFPVRYDECNPQLPYFYISSDSNARLPSPAFPSLPHRTAGTPSTDSNFSRDVRFAQYQEQNDAALRHRNDGSLSFDLSKASSGTYDHVITSINRSEIENPEGSFEDWCSENDQRESRSVTADRALNSPSLDDRVASKAASDPRAPGGLTALQTAAFFAHEAIIGLLLDKGADIEGASANGLTALHIASMQGCSGAVKLLLSRGAYVGARDHLGQTALHLAAWDGHCTTMQVLLENRAYMEAVDHRGSTVLHVAAQQGWQAVVQVLLERGAKVNAKDGAGRTALHRAAEQGHEAVVRILLMKGVDINAKTEDR